MKNFFGWLFAGAAITLGSRLATKLVDTFKDPVSKGKMKKGLKNFKEAFQKEQ